MAKEPWIVFYGPDGKELGSYTVRGSFPGELEDTISMLAYERGLMESKISFAEITR